MHGPAGSTWPTGRVGFVTSGSAGLDLGLIVHVGVPPYVAISRSGFSGHAYNGSRFKPRHHPGQEDRFERTGPQGRVASDFDSPCHSGEIHPWFMEPVFVEREIVVPAGHRHPTET